MQPKAAPPVFQPTQNVQKKDARASAPPIYNPARESGFLPAPWVFSARPLSPRNPAQDVAIHSTMVLHAKSIQAKYGLEDAKRTKPLSQEKRWNNAHKKVGSQSAWSNMVEKANNIVELEKLAMDYKKAVEQEKQRIAGEKNEKEKIAARKKLEKQRAEAEKQKTSEQPKERRRLESVTHLLENPDNVCVALAVGHRDKSLHATTNRGFLSPLSFSEDGKTLKVTNLHGGSGKVDEELYAERQRHDIASKVWGYVEEQENRWLAKAVNEITTVDDRNNGIHAEMKLLDYLVEQGATGRVNIYVSKLCCLKCRTAIDCWNASNHEPKIDCPEGHGDHYAGWNPPVCITNDQALWAQIEKKLNALPIDGEDQEPSNYYGRARVKNERSQRRRSISPPPRRAWAELSPACADKDIIIRKMIYSTCRLEADAK